MGRSLWSSHSVRMRGSQFMNTRAQPFSLQQSACQQLPQDADGKPQSNRNPYRVQPPPGFVHTFSLRVHLQPCCCPVGSRPWEQASPGYKVYRSLLFHGFSRQSFSVRSRPSWTSIGSPSWPQAPETAPPPLPGAPGSGVCAATTQPVLPLFWFMTCSRRDPVPQVEVQVEMPLLKPLLKAY